MLQVGIASSIGEQPIKGLLNPAAGARMTVAEALTNLVFARISELEVNVQFLLGILKLIQIYKFK
jgi:phosphoribosylformylglycinamidine (FGAM) synthase-like enzyme